MSSTQTNHKATVLRAAWIAPMDRPPFRDGSIKIIDGRIGAVGRIDEIDTGGAEIVELPESILLPGLINAHTHLELSDFRQPAMGDGNFVDWLKNLMSQTPRDEGTLAELVTHAIGIGVEQCLKFGVTCVGDISRQCHLSRPLLAKSPLRVMSYGEVTAMGQRRDLLEPRLMEVLESPVASEHLKIGITPHAPYSVEPFAYRRCLEIARQRKMPLATHWAETLFEADFLNEHTGPFRDLWSWLNRWDENVPKFEGSPVAFAASLGLLDYPTLLAHVNYCSDDDLELLSHGKASVVYCPRTHEYFGHPPHRFREMLARGMNVALGTDSCASSPDLNLVDDLRLVRKLAPEISAEMLWEMVTTRAAKAVNLQGEVGSLSVGKWGDVVAFPANEKNPLAAILDEPFSAKVVWIRGQQIA